MPLYLHKANVNLPHFAQISLYTLYNLTSLPHSANYYIAHQRTYLCISKEVVGVYTLRLYLKSTKKTPGIKIQPTHKLRRSTSTVWCAKIFLPLDHNSQTLKGSAYGVGKNGIAPKRQVTLIFI